MNLKKNQTVTLTIEDIGTDGEGIGKLEGFPIFVKDALPGDVITAGITKAKKNYAFGRLLEILTPSPDRVDPPCPRHRSCGGCQIQALSYEKQKEFKFIKVRNNLIRIGGFAPDVVDSILEPIIGMEDPWRYRNKAQYPIGKNKEGAPIAGFYAGRTHSIVAGTDCLIGVCDNEPILEAILTYMKENGVSAYDETTGKGFLRHVLIRKGFSSKQLMVCLIINAAWKQEHTLPAQQKLIDLLAGIPNMTSVSVNINRENTNVILGSKTYTIWGNERITDTLHLLRVEGDDFCRTDHSVTYAISPQSFYQVNPIQTEKLYSVALDYAGLTGKESVWDLYCGIGTISLFLAGKAKKVYGVEIIEQAILDARENARLNGIENAEFFVGKAEEVLPEFYAKPELDEELRHPDVIVVDPPRKGCDGMCLDTILKMAPPKVVYVSCDSATLARDLKILCDGGYELKRVRPCDQFCHSTHVETCVLLSNRKEITS